MAPIIVQLGPMPTMLRSIVRDLLRIETDIEIVDGSVERDNCLNSARENNADLLIVQDEVQDGASCLDLLLAPQSVGLLGIAIDGRSATRISIAREPIRLDVGQRSSLADAIRKITGDIRASSSAPAVRDQRPSVVHPETNGIPAAGPRGRRPSGDP